MNPIWNEHFEFIVEDASTQHLVVKVYDDEGVQASELLGCAQIRLSELQPGKVKDAWLNLVKDLEVQRDTKDRGQVRMTGFLALRKEHYIIISDCIEVSAIVIFLFYVATGEFYSTGDENMSLTEV